MKKRIRKFFSLFLALVMVFSLLPAKALAEEPEGSIAPAEDPSPATEESVERADEPDASGTIAPVAETEATIEHEGTCGDNLTWTLDSDGMLTISGTGAMWDFTYSNTAKFFEYRDKIKALKLKSGVTSIGNYAFRSCYNMADVSIPESVTSIGEYAFEYCYALTAATIPASVTSIEQSAFCYCRELASISVVSGNTAYSSEDGVLYDKGKTTLLCCPGGKSGVCTIPASVESIFVYYAFFECDKLTGISVVSENASYSSEDGVLFNKDKTRLLLCPRAKSGTCTIPDGVTSVEGHAFEYCKNLTEIRIPDSVTTFGVYSFWYCTALESVTIPKGIKTLNAYVFAYCDNLTSIRIPAGVTRISYGAFMDSGLTEIRCLGSAPTFENDVFSNVTATAYYPAEDETWTESVRQNYGGTITWEEHGTLASGECGAEGDNLLWNLNENGRLRIQGSGEMANWATRGAPWYSYREQISSVQISGASTIGAFAFEDCTALEKVSMPETLRIIGRYSFYNCAKLTEALLPTNLTNLSDSCFYKSGLRSAFIPAGVTSIPQQCFRQCTRLESVSIPDSVTYVGSNVFTGCSVLSEVSIPDSVTTMGGSVFSNCTALKNVTLSKGLTMIMNRTFLGCTSLESVTIPAGVLEVRDLCFYGCTALTEIRFLGSAPSFGDRPFYLVTATAFYPAGDESWTEDVRQDYGGTLTWIPYAPPASPGDLNRDGSVNVLDLLVLRKYLLELPIEGTFDEDAADLNGDGTIDILDLVRFRKTFVT